MMMNAIDAIDAIDLTTYEGEDPCLIHESACQNCHATQSQKPLTRCSTCSVVWYCSDECVEADSDRHGSSCRNYVFAKASVDTRVQELRERHDIEDPYAPILCLGWAKGAHVWEARRSLYHDMRDMSSNLEDLATMGDTKELWEMVLDCRLKAVRMRNRYFWMDDDNVTNIAFTLIRLDRLEDAWRFVRNSMIQYTYGGWSVIEYEPQDHFSDCLDWVRSFHNLTYSFVDMQPDYFRQETKSFQNLILGLIIIKLRIRAVAARDAWKETIKVFLQTDQGWELEPVKYLLEEYFSLSDDTMQLEQVSELMSIVHSCSSFMDFLEPNTALWYSEVNDNARICLRRTPQGHELLSEVLHSERFIDRCTKLRAVGHLAMGIEKDKKMYMGLGGYSAALFALARYVLIQREGMARRFGYYMIAFMSWMTWRFLLKGVLLCAVGTIFGAERSWGWIEAMQKVAIVLMAVLLVRCLFSTLCDQLLQKSNPDDLTKADLFYAFVDDWLADEMLPVSVISIILWWKVVPTPSSMNVRKGTRAIISAVLLISMIYTYTS